MKNKKNQSTQTDGSGGAKMSVKDQAEISRHIDIKKRIGNLEDRLHELRQRTKSFDPDGFVILKEVVAFAPLSSIARLIVPEEFVAEEKVPLLFAVYD